MQIGTLQDEEEEGAAPAADEAPESFAHSVLGTNHNEAACTFWQYTHRSTNKHGHINGFFKPLYINCKHHYT